MRVHVYYFTSLRFIISQSFLGPRVQPELLYRHREPATLAALLVARQVQGNNHWILTKALIRTFQEITGTNSFMQ